MSIISDSKALRKTATDAIFNHQASQKPNVVVYGALNAGKSSLLNMLTGHLNNECFKVNDFRETTHNKNFDMGDIIYTDTPGLDANDNDNQTASLGIKMADIVLFVHQAPGELDKKELEFLTQLRHSFGEYANSNLILVISKIESIDNQALDDIQEKIKNQCQEHLNFVPQCFFISNKRYAKGKTENKQTLISASHIDELKDAIDNGIKYAQLARQKRIKNEYLSLLIAKRTELQNTLNDTQTELDVHTNTLQEFGQYIKELEELINSHAKQYHTTSKQNLPYPSLIGAAAFGGTNAYFDDTKDPALFSELTT